MAHQEKTAGSACQRYAQIEQFTIENRRLLIFICYSICRGLMKRQYSKVNIIRYAKSEHKSDGCLREGFADLMLKAATYYSAGTGGIDLCSGSTTANVVPWPTALVTSMRPWWSSTMRRANDSPRPVPSPLVV